MASSDVALVAVPDAGEPAASTTLTSFVGIVLVLVFFITSSDSGSLVIDSITAGGKLDAPVPSGSSGPRWKG
jgi:choline-glycine betaine transporter